MTGRAPVGLDRSMFINKRALLIRVTLNASCICTGRQSGLLQFKTAMRIMTIATLHGAFENFVMGRQLELVLNFGVTAQTKLRLARSQQLDHREARLLSVGFADKHVRTGQVFPGLRGMR